MEDEINGLVVVKVLIFYGLTAAIQVLLNLFFDIGTPTFQGYVDTDNLYLELALTAYIVFPLALACWSIGLILTWDSIHWYLAVLLSGLCLFGAAALSNWMFPENYIPASETWSATSEQHFATRIFAVGVSSLYGFWIILGWKNVLMAVVFAIYGHYKLGSFDRLLGR